jgi:hypothetical protein
MHTGCNFNKVVYISLPFFWFALWMPYKQDQALIQNKIYEQLTGSILVMKI